MRLQDTVRYSVRGGVGSSGKFCYCNVLRDAYRARVRKGEINSPNKYNYHFPGEKSFESSSGISKKKSS
jgi:hypothetical protein